MNNSLGYYVCTSVGGFVAFILSALTIFLTILYPPADLLQSLGLTSAQIQGVCSSLTTTTAQ